MQRAKFSNRGARGNSIPRVALAWAVVAAMICILAPGASQAALRQTGAERAASSDTRIHRERGHSYYVERGRRVYLARVRSHQKHHKKRSHRWHEYRRQEGSHGRPGGR